MKKGSDSLEHRRNILKLMMLGSGALIVPSMFTGCGGNTHSDQKPPYEPPTDEEPPAPPEEKIGTFPQSIASGDPRPDSVILWTRIYDSEKIDEDLEVILELSLDEEFEDISFTKTLTAYHVYDHSIKVKIDQLEPATYYYYRFTYKDEYSNIGRTKTAPLQGSTENIKFAYISCQDYIGRYYNVFAHLLQQDDLDFIVHLGDYIYETNGEPLSQVISDERQFSFRDTEGMISFGSYAAARSIDNYRQLYQVYRSDPLLQRLHERFPMIAIWDDHEFSDDSYGPNGNYYGNRISEEDLVRFHNSQRVYLEYMPLDVGLDTEGVMSPESEVILDDENDVVIYRDFNFGSNLDLILSDYRSYRPDHLIREDAFPATVFANEERIRTVFGDQFYDDMESGGSLGAYIDIGTYHDGEHESVLKMIAKIMYKDQGLNESLAEQKANEVIHGELNAFYCNEMIKAYNDSILGAVDEKELIYTSETELDQMQKGLAYINGGKIDLFAATGIGARFMVIKEVFDVYIHLRSLEGNIGYVYGSEQDQWINDVLTASSANWRIYASSVSMAPMIVDLSNIEALDEQLKRVFYLNLDQFDGFTFQRDLLLEKLREAPSVVISGDIHSTFVTDHHGVIEFTGSSVSSCTFSEALPKYIEHSDISEYIENIEDIIADLDLDQLIHESNVAQCAQDPDLSVIKVSDMKSNAYVVIEVSEESLNSTIYSIDAKRSVEDLYADPHLNDHFLVRSFHVPRETMVIE